MKVVEANGLEIAAIPDTTLVLIPDCGHASNLEQPEHVNQAVREFCRAH